MKHPEHNAIRILETPGSVDVGMLCLSDQEPLRRASLEDRFDIDDPKIVVVVEADQVSVPVHKGEAPRHSTLGVSDRSHGLIGMVDPRCRSSCSGSEETNVTVGHAKGEVAATAGHAETGGPRQLIGSVRREVEPTKPTVTALNGDHGASDIEAGGVDRVGARLEHEAVRVVVDVKRSALWKHGKEACISRDGHVDDALPRWKRVGLIEVASRLDNGRLARTLSAVADPVGELVTVRDDAVLANACDGNGGTEGE